MMKNNQGFSQDMRKLNNSDVSVHSIKTAYQGFFKMNEYSLQHTLFSGEQSQSFTREVFERGDAVVVMAYDIEQDKLLLIEQFRAGAIRGNDSPWLLEFIAGMFDENESPMDVALREAKEEANIDIRSESLVPIMQYLSSPGGMSERIHLYFSDFDSSQVEVGAAFGLAQENEDILLHLVSLAQASALLSEGKITNASTIIGLQWLLMNHSSLSMK
jgi:ADP-ribose pyrophosphatase